MKTSVSRVANNTYTNQSDAPKLDGTVGFYKYRKYATPPVRHTDYGQFFGNVLEVGNNAGDDMYWGSSNTLIPFNPNSLYEIEVRVKKRPQVQVVSIVV